MSSELCRSSGPQSEKKESEKIKKYLDLARELKKAMQHGDGDSNCSLWSKVYKSELEITDRPNHSIVKIS